MISPPKTKAEAEIVTNDKNCYCFTCKKELHYLGIASHRAAHRNRSEKCKIMYTNGDVYEHDFSKQHSEKVSDK